MARAIFIRTRREGYAPSQCGTTITVGEMIEILENFSPDTLIYTSHDRANTFGSINENDISFRSTEIDIEDGGVDL